MKLIEKKINSKVVFEGKVFDVLVDDIILPDESPSKREVVKHRGGVCIAAMTDDKRFLLVEQFRYPHNKTTLEFPAGKVEIGEEHLFTAQRELLEECGYVSNNWVHLGHCLPTPGYSSEVIQLFLATDLIYQGQQLDEGEFLNIKSYNFSELTDLVVNNELNDAKTICLLFKLQEYLKLNK